MKFLILIGFFIVAMTAHAQQLMDPPKPYDNYPEGIHWVGSKDDRSTVECSNGKSYVVGKIVESTEREVGNGPLRTTREFQFEAFCAKEKADIDADHCSWDQDHNKETQKCAKEYTAKHGKSKSADPTTR